MNRTSIVLLLAVACSMGCATAPPARQTRSLPAVAVAPAPVFTNGDAAELRKELENAYARIEARSGAPALDVPVVDVDAILSMDIPEQRSIRGALQYFSTDLHESIQQSLTRSAKYKKLIDKVLDEYKLPRGLAYLPVIESAYSPTLTSRAGAHGMWQFMPDTAREYGLRVDWWVDERADPEKSTRIAAAYLRDLYKQFNDWPLALAAYNAGPGRIRRALTQNGASSFWELSEAAVIPKETRGYVPTFYATLMIASDPATYGFRLTDPASFDDKRLDLDGPVSLKYIADVTGVEETLLRELNPALRRGMLPPGRASLHVPSKIAPVVAERASTLKTDDTEIRLTSFNTRDGDTLKRLAKACGTTPEELARMNELRDERLDEGTPLWLPVRGRELRALLDSQQSEKTRKATFYAVAKGDTLYSIAKRYSLTIEELLDLNQLEAETILQPGQKLRVTQRMPLAAGGM
jgi:membrane-bound lytic murein transglycosylase D